MSAAGWLVLDSNSAADYTACGSLTVLRFGIDRPFLFQTGTSCNGEVDANPLADRTGHTLRLIPLSVAEARFLADTLYWLGRVRGLANDPANSKTVCAGSSADGLGTLDWLIEKQAPRHIKGTLWAMRSLAAAWRGKFDDTTCLNFTDVLLTEGLPAHLGNRWDTAAPLTHRNLTTPLPERLQPREDNAARDQLPETLTQVDIVFTPSARAGMLINRLPMHPLRPLLSIWFGEPIVVAKVEIRKEDISMITLRRPPGIEESREYLIDALPPDSDQTRQLAEGMTLSEMRQHLDEQTATPNAPPELLFELGCVISPYVVSRGRKHDTNLNC